MSNFRKFCIGSTAGFGLSAAAANHHVVNSEFSAGVGGELFMIIAGLLFGSLVVALFGE